MKGRAPLSQSQARAAAKKHAARRVDPTYRSGIDMVDEDDTLRSIKTRKRVRPLFGEDPIPLDEYFGRQERRGSRFDDE